MNELIRQPAVAGTFYPGSAGELDRVVAQHLEQGRPAEARPCPKAIVAPHAGYIYSGPIAGKAFALLAPHAQQIERVVLVGPAHRVYVDGLVSPGAHVMRTPLGDVTVDTAALDGAKVPSDPNAHRREHSLEVELPFLQRVAPRAKVVPLAAGRARAAEVAELLEKLWGGPETVIVVSSDLSHYLAYDAGREVDRDTASRIVALDPRPLDGEQACGSAGINGLVAVARKKGMRAELVDLRSSGDTAGSKDEVVGYGAFAFYEGGGNG
jgi:AmmeMemoRadiSam system protein B